MQITAPDALSIEGAFAFGARGSPWTWGVWGALGGQRGWGDLRLEDGKSVCG